MQQEKGGAVYKGIGFVAVICSVLAAVSKLLVGFDIDEGYALALPYRFLQGDRLFSQMWEVHQTSALFASLVLRPFLALTGSVSGLVLYVRVVCTLLHLIVSISVYRAVRLYIEREQAAFLGLVYFNFLPKWMMSVDFSMQFDWFFTICIVCLLYAQYHAQRAEERKLALDLLGCGLSLAFLVLGYPTMALLYPLFLFLLLRRSFREKARRIRAALCLTAGCAVPAAVFLGYLLSYMSVPELAESIQNVFSDGSHQFSGASKWSLWLGHGRDVALQTIITFVPALLLAAAVRLIGRKLSEKKRTPIPFAVLTACCYTLLTSLIVVIAGAVGIGWGPFRLQIRYILMFAMGFALQGSRHVTQTKTGAGENMQTGGESGEETDPGEEGTKERWVRDFCLYPSLLAFALILLASNVGPTSSSSYLVLGVMAMLWLVMTRVSRMEEQKDPTGSRPFVFFAKASLLLFLISIMMCKGYYVRVTGYPPSNLLMERRRIEEGPAKGIYVYPSEWEEMTETYGLIREYTNETDRVLYLGTQALSNLYTDGSCVLPTTISTPAFNEQWIAYFERHPGKMPTVIVLSKTTVDDQEKFFAQNPFGIWLASRYDVQGRLDAKYVCIIRGSSLEESGSVADKACLDAWMNGTCIEIE